MQNYILLLFENLSCCRCTIGIGSHHNVHALERSIALLLEGRVPYEFRTTVVREFHDDDSFRGIAEMIRGAEHYFLQCFTDRDSVLLGGLHAPSREDMERFSDLVRPAVKDVQIRGMD